MSLRDPLSERVRIHVHVEELRAQLSDHREVDPVLELAEGISAGRSGNGSGGGESLVEVHQCFLPHLRRPPFFDPSADLVHRRE